MYGYYNLPKGLYCAYKMITTSIFIGLILFQLKFIRRKNIKKLTKTFWLMLFLIGLIILFEIYLQSKNIGKG